MENECKTLILRFRDLVTASNQTWEKHLKICKEKKFVWWGWWSKGGEKVPIQLFTKLAKEAKVKGLEVLFLDSGHNYIYKAICSDIKYSDKGNNIPTPSKGNTPNYYSENEYLAWFKFSKMYETISDESILKKYSYVEYQEFYETERLNYPFDGKIVCSANELRSQDRSIWFIRDRKDGDKTEEIILLNSTAVQPDHFQKNFKSTEKKQILWLSDLHFGRQSFPLQNVPTKKPLFLRLTDAVNKIKIKPASIIISGDITWEGKKEQFDEALTFLKNFKSGIGIDNLDYILCPGNHDILWELKPKEKDESIDFVYDKYSKEYRNFYKSLLYIEPNQYLSMGRRFILANSYPVEIVSLNSVRLQQTMNDFQGFGYVGSDQLTAVEREYGLAEKQSDSPFRILIFHHHLFPITPVESPTAQKNYSITLDSEIITRWALDNKFDLVLHGHMHQPNYVQIKRPVKFENFHAKEEDMRTLTICALGSTGVDKNFLGEYKQNTFGVLTFTDNLLNVKIYDIDAETMVDDKCKFEFNLPIR